MYIDISYMPPRTLETKLNIYLSEILNSKLGIQSISETSRSNKRPDILIYVGGFKIVLEGSYTKKDAEYDVRAKIDGGLVMLGLLSGTKKK